MPVCARAQYIRLATACMTSTVVRGCGGRGGCDRRKYCIYIGRRLHKLREEKRRTKKVTNYGGGSSGRRVSICDH